MKKTLFNVTLAMAVFGMTFTACKKDSETQPQTEEVAVEDNNSGLSDSEDIVFVSDSAMVGVIYEGGYFDGYQEAEGRISREQPKSFNGATVTFTAKGMNATGKVEVDFGTGIVWRGKTHKGKVVVTYTESRRISGAVRTITFDNYSINDNAVDGTKTVTFTSVSGEGSATFSVSVDAKIKIKTKAGKDLVWNSLRTRIYDTKGTFDNWKDDEVTLSGNANGVNRNGVKYSAVITTPLTVKLSCVETSGWIPSSGVLEVTPEGAAKRSVNYGSGSCDRTVTVTVGDRSSEWTAK